MIVRTSLFWLPSAALAHFSRKSSSVAKPFWSVLNEAISGSRCPSESCRDSKTARCKLVSQNNAARSSLKLRLSKLMTGCCIRLTIENVVDVEGDTAGTTFLTPCAFSGSCCPSISSVQSKRPSTGQKLRRSNFVTGRRIHLTTENVADVERGDRNNQCRQYYSMGTFRCLRLDAVFISQEKTWYMWSIECPYRKYYLFGTLYLEKNAPQRARRRLNFVHSAFL